MGPCGCLSTYTRLIVVSQPQICLVPYVCIEDLFQKKKPWTWVKTKGYDTTPLKEKDIQVIIKGQRRLNSSLYLEQGIGFVCEDELSYNHQSRC
ncbi:hypothetical protein P8452_59170 [Trifolium repens]|nr:hypothetical protein P8452_59170 [Trifolium repens]